MNVDLLIYTTGDKPAAFVALLLVLHGLPFRMDRDIHGGYGYTVRNLPVNVAAQVKQTVEQNSQASVTEI